MKEVGLEGKTPIAGIDRVDPETQIDAARVQTPLIYCVLSPTTTIYM